MTILKIISYPNPLLRQKTVQVIMFDAALKQLSDDLLETMYAAPGLGITAPHVGIMLRITVIDLEAGSPRIFVNPRISWSSAELSSATEGSVSMPGVREELKRPAKVRVVYNTLDGDMLEEEAEGFMATCLQHEIDQLDGIFWIDRLSKLKRGRLIKRYSKLQRS